MAINVIIEKWKKHKDPLAHAAVCELLLCQRMDFSIDEVRVRFKRLGLKNKAGGATGEIRAVNTARNQYRRAALKELGIKMKEKEMLT